MVNAVAEGDVAAGVAAEVEAVRVGELGGIPVGGTDRGKTHSPAGMSTSPMGTSSVVNRSLAWFTGLVNRSSSSTAAGSSDGSARSRAISPGWISSASVPEAIRLTVVSKPAMTSRKTVASSSLAGQPVLGAVRVGVVAGEDERRYQVVAGLGPLGGDQLREVGGQFPLYAGSCCARSS